MPAFSIASQRLRAAQERRSAMRPRAAPAGMCQHDGLGAPAAPHRPHLREQSIALLTGIVDASAGGRATHYGGGDAIGSSLDAGSCMMKIDGPKFVAAAACAGSGNTVRCSGCAAPSVRAADAAPHGGRAGQVRPVLRGHVRGRPHPRAEQQPLRRRPLRLPRPRPQVRCGAGHGLLPLQLPAQPGVQQHVVLVRHQSFQQHSPAASP